MNVELFTKLVSNVCDLIISEIDTLVIFKAGEITLKGSNLIVVTSGKQRDVLGLPEKKPKYVEKITYDTCTQVVLRDPYSPDVEVREISELNVYELLRLYEHLINI